MGSEIVLFLEVKENGKWKFISEQDLPRAYNMFAILSGVRKYIDVEPITTRTNIPDDASKFVKKEAERWDIFYSFVITQKMIEEYDWKKEVADPREWQNKKDLYKLTEMIPDKFKKLFERMKKLSKEYGNENVRIVFWYDS